MQPPATPDTPLDWQMLQQAVPNWHVEYHSQLDSTNHYACTQAATFGPLSLIVAETQTAGKGRGKNQWWSAPGGLTFSLVLQPSQWQIPLQQQTLLSLLTAAIVRDVVCRSGLISRREVELKWPNDVYLRSRKLCGILLEHAPLVPDRLIIGIGLNVNNSWAQAPPALQTVGTALCDASGCLWSREQLLADLLSQWETLLNDAPARLPFLHAAWQEAHLLEGRIITLDQAGQHRSGRCEGLDEDGALLLRDTYGLHRIHSAIILDWE